MRYLTTILGTDFTPPNRGTQILTSALGAMIPRANPDYNGIIHLVKRWYFEVDDAAVPQREVGVDASGAAIWAAPWGRNLGVWTDQGSLPGDANASEIPEVAFAKLWREFNGSAFALRLARGSDA